MSMGIIKRKEMVDMTDFIGFNYLLFFYYTFQRISIDSRFFPYTRGSSPQGISLHNINGFYGKFPVAVYALPYKRKNKS